MKRTVSLMLALLMALGCVAVAAAQEVENPWAQLDLSEYVEVNFYVVGTLGDDWQEVTDAANALMIEKINTKVNFVHVSWADFQTKYSLFLANDENVDIIYGAAWTNYLDYLGAGAYKGFDWEFVETYMPLAAEKQVKSSWNEVKFNDQYYAVPNNQSGIGSNGVVTTQALLDQYGFKAEDIKTFEDLIEYYYAIAADRNETGVYPLNPQGSYPTDAFHWFTTRYHLRDVEAGNGTWMVWPYATGKEFAVEDFVWFADTQEYRDYCLQMAEFYAAGVFPSSVIANDTMIDDNFRSGTSATNYVGPGNVPGLRESMPNEEIVFINCFWDDQSSTRRGGYMGYGAFFPTASKKTERAAVALDCMKFDPEVNRLLVSGIEGRHYILNEENNTYTMGPEASDYSWGAWCYMLGHDGDPQLELPEDLQAYRQMYEDAEVPSETFPVNGFRFDASAFEAEMTVINALFAEYRFSFCFGLFGDQTEAKLDEFISQCKAAGIDDIVQAYRDQLTEHLSSI